jgi:hypothetical protein
VRSASEHSDDLNTEFWDDIGSISDGGRRIIFTSDRHYWRDRDGVEYEKDSKHFDLWVGTREETSEPFTGFTNRGILENVNSEHAECSSTLSADGLNLAFLSKRRGGNVDIWTATRPDVTVPFGEPSMPLGLNTESIDSNPYFSARMETIYFASTRDEPDSMGQTSFGHLDLYQATLTNGIYSNVINLGGSREGPFDQFVNSPSREISPVVFEEGLRIFWSETHHQPRNGDNADIWVATRATTQEPFGNVRNLGPPVNSADHETSFYITQDWPAEGSEIWFTRGTASGKADIWMATWVPDVPDRPFRRGDVSGDGNFNLTDGVAILSFLFAGVSQPDCLDAADTNDDGAVNINDAVGLLNHLFAGGPPPRAPFEECGTDPTDDDFLHCPASPCL